jgi:hypothetical protein
MTSRRYVLLLSIPFLVLAFSSPAAAADRFNNTQRWSSFDLATVNSTLKGFSSGISGGGYIYYIPWYNGADFSGNTVRYDTTKPFTDPASYEYFNITRINGTLKSFVGGAAVGSYVYLVPSTNWGGAHGNTVRYDTTKPFADPASWEYFNVTRVNGTLKGFWGGISSGDHVYFVPYYNDITYTNGNTVRHDATRPFTDPASWEYFNITRLNSNLGGYSGGTASGHFVYYAPYSNDVDSHGYAVRYDTTGSFTDPAAWEYVDITQLNPSLKGFSWATASGNYVYYVPYYHGAGYSGVTARYDTT